MGLGHSLHCEQKSPQHEQHEHWTTCSTCPKDGDDFLIDDNNFPLITIMMSSIPNMGAFGWFLQEWKLFSCSTGGNHPYNCHHLQEPRWGSECKCHHRWNWRGSLGSLNLLIGSSEFVKTIQTTFDQNQVEASSPFTTSRSKWKESNREESSWGEEASSCAHIR